MLIYTICLISIICIICIIVSHYRDMTDVNLLRIEKLNCEIPNIHTRLISYNVNYNFRLVPHTHNYGQLISEILRKLPKTSRKFYMVTKIYKFKCKHDVSRVPIKFKEFCDVLVILPCSQSATINTKYICYKNSFAIFTNNKTILIQSDEFLIFVVRAFVTWEL